MFVQPHEVDGVGLVSFSPVTSPYVALIIVCPGNVTSFWCSVFELSMAGTRGVEHDTNGNIHCITFGQHHHAVGVVDDEAG